MVLGLMHQRERSLTSAPWAALGGNASLNPPKPLFEVTQDDLDRARQQLARFWTEYAELEKTFEYERGMGISAATYTGANAARNACDDIHHDFINQY